MLLLLEILGIIVLVLIIGYFIFIASIMGKVFNQILKELKKD